MDEPNLVQFLEKVRRQHARGPFVPVSAREFNRLWVRAAVLLDLPSTIGMPHVYVLRHSGASADKVMLRRTLPEIKSRGRWRSDSSVRRYQKGGRSLERLAALSPKTREFALKCERRAWKVLARLLLPLSLPRLDMP